MDAFERFADSLTRAGVRFVVIGRVPAKFERYVNGTDYRITWVVKESGSVRWYPARQ